MNKKIVFFDGDGTLWYPKTTKHKEKPHWIYRNDKTKDNPNPHLELLPNVVKTLKKLKKLGIIIVILSANPHSSKIANKMMKDKVEHFNLNHLFDEVHATPPVMEAKGQFIIEILNKLHLNKKDALMVGESYLCDCKSARNVGVDSLLIDSQYRKDCPSGSKAKRVIKKLIDVLDYI